jgi:hypothetical protein
VVHQEYIQPYREGGQGKEGVQTNWLLLTFRVAAEELYYKKVRRQGVVEEVQH